MDYAVEPDVPFLADCLEGLARLNVRHFREDLSLAQTVLRRMLDKDYQWVRETPDTWQDVKELAKKNRKKFDCEDFAAAFAALMVICFGEAKVGIRRVDKHLCHALAGKDASTFDICPLFAMPGTSDGPVEWRTIKEKPMIAEGLTLITSGVRRLMAASEEKPANAELDLDTGASLSSTLASLLPPAALARLGNLENEVKDVTNQRNAIKKERDALKKERDALKKSLAEMTASRNAQSAQRITAESATAKTKEQLAAESRRLAEARAFHTACKEQLQQVLSRSPDQSAKALAREGLQRLERESPEDWMDSFLDADQREHAWELLATGAAHIATLPDCDACGRGEPCTAGVGAADEPNGDEPPDNTSGPDSEDDAVGYDNTSGPDSEDDVVGYDNTSGPDSEDDVSLELAGCGGSCPPR